jgi:hypothetical protein
VRANPTATVAANSLRMIDFLRLFLRACAEEKAYRSVHYMTRI